MSLYAFILHICTQEAGCTRSEEISEFTTKNEFCQIMGLRVPSYTEVFNMQYRYFEAYGKTFKEAIQNMKIECERHNLPPLVYHEGSKMYVCGTLHLFPLSGCCINPCKWEECHSPVFVFGGEGQFRLVVYIGDEG